MPDDYETSGKSFKDSAYSVSFKVYKFPRRKHQDFGSIVNMHNLHKLWIDEKNTDIKNASKE